MTNDKGGNGGGEMRAAEAALQRMILRGAWIGKDLRAAIDEFGARLEHSVEPGGDPDKALEWAGGNLLAAVANVDTRTLALVRAEFDGALAIAGSDPRAEAAHLSGAARSAAGVSYVSPDGLTIAAARLVAGACAALALSELTSTDERWLLARSRGESTEHPDPERAASYGRMEGELSRLPPESPGERWQDGVRALIDLSDAAERHTRLASTLLQVGGWLLATCLPAAFGGLLFGALWVAGAGAALVIVGAASLVAAYAHDRRAAKARATLVERERAGRRSLP